MGLDALTWRCEVCGDTRPDGRVATASVEGMLGVVELKTTVRHCVDRPECVEGGWRLAYGRFAKVALVPDPS